MTDLKVVKRDGSIVDFDAKKVYDACISAGATKKIAEEVMNSVVEDLHHIKSETIRRRILKRLKKLDKEVADNLIKYDIEHPRYNEDEFLKF